MPPAARASLIFLATLAAARAQCPHLTSPPPGAHPDSAYIAFEGSAAPNSAIYILGGDSALASTLASARADADGRFERVLRLAAGRHVLEVQAGRCAPMRVSLTVPSEPAPSGAFPFERMHAADVILAHNRESRQDPIYKPVYTHSALYIGAAPNGAARLLEAATEEDASPRGPVAAVPIEESLAFRFGERVDLFRAKPALSAGDRDRILAWSRRVAAQGLPFWTNQDFGDVYRAWLMWDAAADRPRDPEAFAQLLAAMRERLDSVNAFDCATLVWHAYRDNTAAHIDLAVPNLAQFGGLAESAPPKLAAALRPMLIVPDTFAMSGKLEQVRGR